MTKTILVYGGAFNPPTIGHQAILQACIDYARSTQGGEVWLLPSGENNKKKTGVPRAARLRYLELLIASVDSKGVTVRIDTTELDDARKIDKPETVRAFMRLYPGYRFVWVYGSDSLATIDRWGGAWLKANTNMLIVPRDGVPVADLPEHTQVLPVAVASGVSSSEVRRRIAAGESYEQLVPPEIYHLLSARLSF